MTTKQLIKLMKKEMVNKEMDFLKMVGIFERLTGQEFKEDIDEQNKDNIIQDDIKKGNFALYFNEKETNIIIEFDILEDKSSISNMIIKPYYIYEN